MCVLRNDVKSKIHSFLCHALCLSLNLSSLFQWRILGGGGGERKRRIRLPPTSPAQNFLIFMQFFAENWPSNRLVPNLVLAPPSSVNSWIHPLCFFLSHLEVRVPVRGEPSEGSGRVEQTCAEEVHGVCECQRRQVRGSRTAHVLCVKHLQKNKHNEEGDALEMSRNDQASFKCVNV